MDMTREMMIAHLALFGFRPVFIADVGMSALWSLSEHRLLRRVRVTTQYPVTTDEKWGTEPPMLEDTWDALNDETLQGAVARTLEQENVTPHP